MKTTLPLLGSLILPLLLQAEQWPGWRGPQGNGVTSEKQIPLRWSTNENVRWRVSLPGRGNSSPIVWGDRVFVTQAVSGENRRTVMCFNRTSGELMWQSGVTYTEKEQTQRDNPYCAATPVTDGERVIASFGSAGLYCYDFAGKELWHREFGKMNHAFGNASSPVIHGDLCFFNFGPDEKARLIAVNKRTGETAWEAEPPKVDPSEQPSPRGFGPGTSVAAEFLAHADKNKDEKVSKDEFTTMGESWFDRMDAERSGKLTREQFIEKLTDVLPRQGGGGGGGGGGGSAGGGGAGAGGGGGTAAASQPGGPGAPGTPPGPAGQGGPGGRRALTGGGPRSVAPGLFAAVDSDKDGAVSRSEMKNVFAKWATDWDADKNGVLNEDEVRNGLNSVLPRVEFAGGGPGGPGGPGGRGGPGRGPGGGGGGGGGGFGGGTWSTPLVIHAGDHDEVIMNFPNRLAAYDPKTGKQLWLSKGLGGTIYTTPLWGEGAVIAMSSGMGGGNAVALKPGGNGDVTESQRLWRLDRIKSGIGSGVIYDGHIYLVSQDGVAQCLDAKSGKVIWEERLRGTGARNGSWSSMLLAGERIYVPNQGGDVFVLRASPKFELLATNSVSEPTNASLAAAGDALYLRTDASLWCLAGK